MPWLCSGKVFDKMFLCDNLKGSHGALPDVQPQSRNACLCWLDLAAFSKVLQEKK